MKNLSSSNGIDMRNLLTFYPKITEKNNELLISVSRVFFLSDLYNQIADTSSTGLTEKRIKSDKSGIKLEFLL